ncbi:MAG: hypothetical protein ABEJ04_06175 [Halobacteriaceae archaeon]
MTETDQNHIEVEQNDVSVEKTIRTADEDLSHVVFSITSERVDSVRVRLVDSIPPTVPTSEVGIHPDHEADWTVQDRSLVFECTLDPEGECTTLYGFRGTDGDLTASFRSEPSVETEPAPRGASATADADVEEAAVAPSRATDGGATSVPDEDAPAGDADPADDGDAATDPDAESRPAPGSAPDRAENGADEADAHEGDDAEGDADEGESVASGASESVASALAAELRAGNVPEEDVEELRAALGADGPSNSLEVRFRRVQRTVEDIAAYKDALEEFIDDNGTGAEAIETLDEDVAAVENRLDDVEERVEEVAAVHEDVAAIEEDVASLRDAVERNSAWREDLQQAISE